jgi:DNA-binding beta-propeller fold protein YncE
MRICLWVSADRVGRAAAGVGAAVAALAMTAGMAGRVSAAPVLPAGRVVTSAVLSGVSCPRPSWCMAVGHYADAGGARHALAQVWDGQSWRVLADPPGPGLVSVSCTAPWFCMVFGSQPAWPTGTMTWNGRAWREVARPHDAVGGPWCGSRSFCLAERLGNESVLEWNGSTWQDRELCVGGDECVTGLSCASASLCAAVGSMRDDFNVLAESAFIWNKDWASLGLGGPYSGPSGLTAVSCTGEVCVAVGDGGFGQPDAIEWNNATQSWQDISPGNGVGVYAGAISCGSSSNCMTSVNTWWNGSTWQNAPFAPAGPGSGLPAMSCAGSICLAVGYQAGSGIQQTLAELWNGTTWKIIATPAFRTPVTRVRDIRVGGSPHQVAIDASRKAVWVAATHQLVRISETTQRVTARVRFPGSLIAVDPKTGTVWAIDQARSVMAEVSEATNRVIRTYTGIGQFSATQNRGGISTDARTGSVWVASSSTLYQISEARHRVVRKITLWAHSSHLQATGIAIDPARNLIWVPIGPAPGAPSRTHHWVAEINGATGAAQTRAAGLGISVVAVDSRHGLVWAWSQASVALIDEADGQINRFLPVPVADNWLAATIDLRRQIVLIADSTYGKFYILEAGQGSANTVRVIPMGAYPADVKADPATGNVYAPVQHSGVVSQFKL